MSPPETNLSAPPPPLPHDAAYKSIFAHTLAVEHLIRGFVANLVEYGPAWFATLDFDTLEPLPTESIDETWRAHFNDFVWRVRFRSATGAGKPHWLHVLVMLEFQSEVDWLMALRIRNYTGMVYRSLWRGRRFGSADRLPPVLPVVLYNGRRRWTAAPCVEELIAPETLPGEGSGARPGAGSVFSGGSYVVVDVGAYEGEQLPADNVVSLVVGSETMSTWEEAAAIMEGAFELLGAPERRELRDTFVRWFDLLVSRAEMDPARPEEATAMERAEQADTMSEVVVERLRALRVLVRAEGREQGHAEGMEQGRAEGMAEERALLRRQAARKYGAKTAGKLVVPLAAIDEPERLAVIGEWIIDCATGDELLARLEDPS